MRQTNATTTQNLQENIEVLPRPSASMASIILEKLEDLPESLQTEVLHFVEFLRDRYVTQSNPPNPQPKKRGGLGILKGKIWMSDDFDEPLEDMKEYM